MNKLNYLSSFMNYPNMLSEITVFLAAYKTWRSMLVMHIADVSFQISLQITAVPTVSTLEVLHLNEKPVIINQVTVNLFFNAQQMEWICDLSLKMPQKGLNSKTTFNHPSEFVLLKTIYQFYKACFYFLLLWWLCPKYLIGNILKIQQISQYGFKLWPYNASHRIYFIIVYKDSLY